MILHFTIFHITVFCQLVWNKAHIFGENVLHGAPVGLHFQKQFKHIIMFLSVHSHLYCYILTLYQTSQLLFSNIIHVHCIQTSASYSYWAPGQGFLFLLCFFSLMLYCCRTTACKLPKHFTRLLRFLFITCEIIPQFCLHLYSTEILDILTSPCFVEFTQNVSVVVTRLD